MDWDGEVARLRDAQDWDAALKGVHLIYMCTYLRRRVPSLTMTLFHTWGCALVRVPRRLRSVWVRIWCAYSGVLGRIPHPAPCITRTGMARAQSPRTPLLSVVALLTRAREGHALRVTSTLSRLCTWAAANPPSGDSADSDATAYGFLYPPFCK